MNLSILSSFSMSRAILFTYITDCHLRLSLPLIHLLHDLAHRKEAQEVLEVRFIH